MPVSDCFISVIAPLYNDSRIIEAFVTETIEILRDNYSNYELVLVNDGSEDGTIEQVSWLLKKYECIRLINLSRHFGCDVAISSGLDSVIGDFIVVMMPSSDPPNLIPKLIIQARNGKDILIGVRSNRSDEPFWLRGGASLFYSIGKRLLGLPLVKNSTQFRVLSRQVVNAIVQLQDNHRYLRLLSFYVGYISDTFTYDLIKRRKYNRTKGLLESLDAALQIIVTNSLRPMKFASYLALFTSLLNAFYMVYIFLIYLIKKKVAEGWITLSFQNSVMFLLISLVLTVLCEYVGLILEQTKAGPSYYVASEKSSSVLIVDQNRRNIVQESRSAEI